MRAVHLLRASLVVVGTSATFWACGGIAKIDPEATGGAGGSTTSSSSSSSGTPPALCKQICDLQAKLNCDVSPTCEKDCEALFGTGCDPEAAALLDCYLQNPPPTCDAPPALCQSELDAFIACVNPTNCSGAECFGNETGCGCKATCFGSVVETDCQGNTCQCKQDGMVVGTCAGPDGDCDPESGCCSQFFFGLE